MNEITHAIAQSIKPRTVHARAVFIVPCCGKRTDELSAMTDSIATSSDSPAINCTGGFGSGVLDVNDWNRVIGCAEAQGDIILIEHLKQALGRNYEAIRKPR